METMADPAEELTAWRKREGLSLAKAGVRLGVAGPTLHDWERGRKRPRDVHRESIMLVVGIDPARWRTKEERAQVERVASQLPPVRSKPVRRTPKGTTPTVPTRAAS